MTAGWLRTGEVNDALAGAGLPSVTATQLGRWAGYGWLVAEGFGRGGGYRVLWHPTTPRMASFILREVASGRGRGPQAYNDALSARLQALSAAVAASPGREWFIVTEGDVVDVRAASDDEVVTACLAADPFTQVACLPIDLTEGRPLD